MLTLVTLIFVMMRIGEKKKKKKKERKIEAEYKVYALR